MHFHLQTIYCFQILHGQNAWTSNNSIVASPHKKRRRQNTCAKPDNNRPADVAQLDAGFVASTSGQQETDVRPGASRPGQETTEITSTATSADSSSRRGPHQSNAESASRHQQPESSNQNDGLVATSRGSSGRQQKQGTGAAAAQQPRVGTGVLSDATTSISTGVGADRSQQQQQTSRKAVDTGAATTATSAQQAPQGQGPVSHHRFWASECHCLSAQPKLGVQPFVVELGNSQRPKTLACVDLQARY